ncbi:hypothetical protein [Plantactinospora sp. DSM 117369]
MRPRLIMVLAVAAIISGGVLLVPATYAKLATTPGPTDSASATPATQRPALTPPPPPTLAAAPVSVPVDAFVAWALLDPRAGGSPVRPTVPR